MNEPGLPTGFKWWCVSTTVTIILYCLLAAIYVGGLVTVWGWEILVKLKIVKSHE